MSKHDVITGEERWLAAFNSGDAAGTAALYAPQARLLAPNVEICEGRDAIEGFIGAFLETGTKLSFDTLTVHETPDLCVAVGRYEMDIPVPDGPAQHDSGKYIEVWGRQADGSWLIVDDIFNSSLPAPAG